MPMKRLEKIVGRVTAMRTTNKNPCKNYATKETAERVGAKYSPLYGEMFNGSGATMNYFPIFVPSWNRWVLAFNMSEAAALPTFVGGYVGQPANDGFFTI